MNTPDDSNLAMSIIYCISRLRPYTILASCNVSMACTYHVISIIEGNNIAASVMILNILN
ncbi:MAG: hypothetical protein ABJB76_10085 [Candidatus Nitrosocosmicus sp.]